MDESDILFIVDGSIGYPPRGLIKIYKTEAGQTIGGALVKTGAAPTVMLNDAEEAPAHYYATFEPLQSVEYQQGCPTLTSASVSIERNVDPQGCYLPGFYREVAGGPCIPITTGPTEPDEFECAPAVAFELPPKQPRFADSRACA